MAPPPGVEELEGPGAPWRLIGKCLGRRCYVTMPVAAPEGPYPLGDSSVIGGRIG